MKPDPTDDSNSLFLVGFMGSGKSVVGVELARALGRTFIDLDEQIEALANQSISQLIRTKGEDEFREIESESLRLVCKSPGTVVATGGGVVLRDINRRLMSESGITIWLDAPFELCWNRIARDRTVRPMAPDRESAWERFRERQNFYRQAEMRVEVSRTIKARKLALTIVRLLKPE